MPPRSSDFLLSEFLFDSLFEDSESSLASFEPLGSSFASFDDLESSELASPEVVVESDAFASLVTTLSPVTV